MTSEEDTGQLVRRLLDAISRRDVEAMLAVTEARVDFKSLLGEVEGGHYHGDDGVREWFRDVVESVNPLDPGLLGLETIGDAVLATGHARGRGATSGTELEWDWVALAHAAGGRLTRFAIYSDREALARGEGLQLPSSPAAPPS